MPYEKPDDPACLRPAPDRANVLLLGDSFAAQLSQELRRAIAPAHLMQATAVGCRPLLDARLASCRSLVSQALEPAELSRITGVVLAGRWIEADARPITDIVKRLRSRGIARVIVIGPVVEYNAEGPDMLGRALLAGELPRVAALRRTDRADLDSKLAAVVARAGGIYVSHFAVECPQGRCRLLTPDGAPVHADFSHMTPQGTVPVARRIADLLR
jgi:hypothetical protein